MLTMFFSCHNKGPTLVELKEQGSELQKKVSENRKLISQQMLTILNLKYKFKEQKGRNIASKPGAIEYIPMDDSDQYFDDLIKKRKAKLQK